MKTSIPKWFATLTIVGILASMTACCLTMPIADNRPIEQLITPSVGYEIGNTCPSADLTVVTKDGFTDQTVNPTTTGTVTILNFWGTWCTPCVQELPYFDQIATDYANRVKVIAVHTNMIADTAPTFIAEHYPDSNITFAHDFENETYYYQLGGNGGYPYTLILDENGVIHKTFISAVHYEELKSAVDELL